MAQPNIIFLLIDDLGCRDLGCFGSSFYETPNLDRMASEGIRFENAYASAPVCSPTRASILSGQYPARVGVTHYIGGQDTGRLASVPYLHYLPLEQKSIATALKAGGYQTWHLGKWHLGDEDFYPEQHGFDCNIGGCHAGHPNNGYFAPWKLPTLEEAPTGTYLTDHLTDQAINLIHNRGDKPFFLNFWHYAVHTPIQAPEHLIKKYQAKAKRLQLDQVNPIIEGEPFPCLHKSDQHITRRVLQSDPAYAAMIENLDTNIGRLLDALEQEGLTEDTLIVMTSDNGGLSTAEGAPTCNAPMSEGKGWAYEGGVRVCQLARWPGRIPAGSLNHENVTSTDLYPTFLEAAQLPLIPEQHVDGISLLDAMTMNKAIPERPIFWHFPHYGNQGDSPSASVLEGEWKLIQHFENSELELYNLEDDVSEAKNIADQKPEIVNRLYHKLRTWQSEVEAKIPEANSEWAQRLKYPKIENNAHI
ncbi:sulfatase [Coraliomargarita sp. SDUM461004]|uniref:Sulfatase n=1 Tax=Thalassobacterium sedimentorum TaxID=3041258 RepID=A0ABU1AJ26_9BACT|nr:sulfatase [Coraliomargarita sp. SDUM461004]MDQ8193870.1 sulfatase [Coraliomargarita sp. SDUM461004]